MLYIVRHCKAAGQQPEAALTADGHLQAVQLAERLNALPIEQVISSPFLRAKQSIAPLAERLGLQIKIDTRLAERVLAVPEVPDWLAALKLSFGRLPTIRPLCRLSIVPRSEGSGWRKRVLLRCDGDLRFVG